MRTKKVNRYWCDFCNKAGLQAGAMRKHEKHCTMNPARECRACALIALDALPLSDLVDMLPDTAAYHSPNQPPYRSEQEETHYQLAESIKAVMPAFREAADNCPACMLAALRLRKIPVPMAEDFDFEIEMKSVLEQHNQNRSDEGYY